MPSRQTSRFFLLTVCSFLALALSGLHAGLIATDEDIPWNMNAGGTADDPALYLLGATGPVTHTISGGAYLGLSESNYNFLLIGSGSTLNSSDGRIGSGATSHYNIAHVVGDGSSWMIGNRLDVGNSGTNNHLSVEEGGHVSVKWAYVGSDASAQNNSLSVLGSGSTMTVTSDLMLGSNGSNNALNVGYGGSLSTGVADIGFESGSDNNEARVYGVGSTWSLRQLAIATYYDAAGNSLTIEDQGLVRISGFSDMEDALTINTAADNFLNFNSGFLAIEGDATDLIAGLIADGAFRFSDGSTWTIGTTDDFLYGYFADEADAFAFSGYSDLAGYTIVTNFAGSPIPEPSTYAALAGCAVLGLAFLRRRR